MTKEEQLNIILKTNPAPNESMSWVRTVEDIKTLSESLEDTDWQYDVFMPDYTRNDALAALSAGIIHVYSSHEIQAGAFVTPSKMEAKSYAGTNTIYEAFVNIENIAWLDPTQGQYTPE